jgi:hypothetical protein
MKPSSRLIWYNRDVAIGRDKVFLVVFGDLDGRTSPLYENKPYPGLQRRRMIITDIPVLSFTTVTPRENSAYLIGSTPFTPDLLPLSFRNLYTPSPLSTKDGTLTGTQQCQSTSE